MLCTTAKVEGVRVEGISDTAVRVEWNPVSGISTEAVSYVVTYNSTVLCTGEQSKMMETVFNGQTEADISDLDPGVAYKFQVAASVEVDGDVFTGVTSDVNSDSISTPEERREGIQTQSACMYDTCFILYHQVKLKKNAHVTKKMVCPCTDHYRHALYYYLEKILYSVGFSAGVLAGAIVGAIAAAVLLYTAVLGVVIAAVVIRQRKKM